MFQKWEKLKEANDNGMNFSNFLLLSLKVPETLYRLASCTVKKPNSKDERSEAESMNCSRK